MPVSSSVSCEEPEIFACFFRPCKHAVNVRAFLRDDRVANYEWCFEAGMERIADPVGRGIYAVNHPNQQRSAGWNRDGLHRLATLLRDLRRALLRPLGWSPGRSAVAKRLEAA